MSFEPILAFFLIRHLRITLKKFAPHPELRKVLLYALYSVAILFILQEVARIEYITQWLWHILLLLLIAAPFKLPGLYTARKAMVAVLPLVVISILHDIIEVVSNSFYLHYSHYFDYLYPVAITWMIAMLVVSHRQQKALEEERNIRQQEEERSRIMAAQKAQLELLVDERTAELTRQKEELQQALTDLKATQSQLIQREKMASLGELTAGIAHEIQNPLNFVNNFSELSVELAAEIQEEINKVNAEADEKENLSHLLHDLVQNQQKINFHGKRADTIVKGMLLHSRSNAGQKEPTDINALVDEYVRLSYHGLRAKDKTFNATLKTHYDENVGTLKVVSQDIGRVILNLCNNAFYAVTKKKQTVKDHYEPTVWVNTKKLPNNKVEICIKDNGTGIPQKVMDKIFQPFFTTKPTGEGTGLGLSLSYDIITKGHGGELTVKTEEGQYTEFTILLPA